MKWILILLISINLYAQDKISIVAVGDATKDKDHLLITSSADKNEAAVNMLTSIIRSDFGFYRHLFELDATLIKETLYHLTLSFKANNLNVKVSNLRSKKNIFNKSYKENFKNIRTFAHTIADEVYKSITGNESIFLSKILFISDRGTTRVKDIKNLYLMDFDGKRKQRITYDNGMIISPSLSKDNSKIIYTSIESRWRKSSKGKIHKVKNPNLYLLDLKTKKKTLISDKMGINSGAVFDSSGENIYLTLSNAKNADIYKMNLKTRSSKRITTHYSDDVDPNVNEDGSLMTFLSGRSGRAMIYTMDPNGVEKKVKRISYVGKFNSAPRFSPDGKQIVFSSWVDNRFDIYKINSDGSNLVRLTKNFGSNEEPWFSPDGQFIVFTSQRVISRKKATQDVYIMNLEGEIISKVTGQYGKIYTPRWSN
ncbi:MAG: hypothetical protein N4A33_02625 [Bacteriovoracaceae bacterium]|jgi:TolB protein|nr:hypothetical protein [Bacteriovoracaceae bacterium]